jgi:uncharacterized lipoprotein YddW (UPF0748 family)
MATITARQNTLFKVSTVDSSALSDSDFADVAKDQSFEIKTLRKEGKHFFVRLAQPISSRDGSVSLASGYFYEEHVETDWKKICGVWLTNVDSDVLFSETSLSQALDELKAVGFNTIYPTVWQGGYTLYPSEIKAPINGSLLLHPTQKFDYPSFSDMLEGVVELGHSKGFRVIPWFEFGLAVPWTKGRPAWLTDALADRWLTKADNGNRVINANEGWASLNPFHDEVRAFMTNLITDVVQRYDVDGIQLDDHFGLPYEQGYDEVTKTLYRKTHRNDPPANAKDNDWKIWRANHITTLMEQIFDSVKAIRPDLSSARKCCISLSPGGFYPSGGSEESFEKFLADWRVWEQTGWIEELVPQFYGN